MAKWEKIKERKGEEGTNWLDISATLCVVDRFSLAVAPRLYFSWLLFSFPFFLLGSFSTFSSLSLSALTLFMMARPDLLADLCSVQLRVSPSPSPVSQPLLCLITINIYYYKQIIFDISYYCCCYILSINNTHSGMAGWLAGWCGNSPRFFRVRATWLPFFHLFLWPGGGGGGKSLTAYSCLAVSCTLDVFWCVTSVEAAVV